MFSSSSKARTNEAQDLTGRVLLVTGGNAGIGKSTVQDLARRGAKVYMGCRSESKALAAIKEIEERYPKAHIHFVEIDLGSFQSVIGAARSLQRKEPKLHGLINNAGIMGVPYAVTTDGYEVQFQTNYLSHWLLTYHLLPLLMSTARDATPGTVRLVNVTSDGHNLFAPTGGIQFDDVSLQSSGSMVRYGQSKLANVLHAKELHRRYGPNADRHVDAGELWTSAVHPGHIDTDLNRQATATASAGALRAFASFGRFVGILADAEKGSVSSIFAIASSNFKRADSGGYVVPYAKMGRPSVYARDGELAERLWRWTADQMNEKGLLTL